MRIKTDFAPARLGTVILACLAFGIPVSPSAAAVIYVPAERPTIQNAIEAAADGDTVLVAPGTYVEIIDFLGKAITVMSESGPDATVIDGNQADSVVTFASGERRASVLDGFTIRNGSALFHGGGIRIEQASPTIRHNAITDNGACFGHGISISAGSPLIQANIIARNQAAATCSGGNGGGIYASGMTAAPEILDNLIADNAAYFGGGIQLLAAGAVVVRGNVIMGNTVGFDGGGIDISNFSDAVIVQNIIVGNTAFQGGGIAWGASETRVGVRFVNNTIVGNDSDQGSGIYAVGFHPLTRVVNNLVIGKAGQAAIACDRDFDSFQPPVLQFNDVFTPGSAAYAGGCPNRTGEAGNISADPLFADSGSGDYRLREGSPAIDAGINLAGLPVTDFEGTARLVDGDADGDVRIDMGVHEFNAADPFVVISPASHDFGSVEAGTSAQRTFTVRNIGRETLSFSIASTSAFGIASARSFVLEPGQSGSVFVRFEPPDQAVFAGSVEFKFAGQRVSRSVRGVGARFFELDVQRQGGESIPVLSDPPGIACGPTCFSRYPEGTVVTLTAIAGPLAVFDGWSACDEVDGPACRVTLNTDRSVAVLSADVVTLAIATSGTGRGSISSAPDGISCGGSCLARFSGTTTVTLTATPAPGSFFVGWSACPGRGTCAVTMSGPRLVTATFTRLPDLTATNVVAGPNAQTGRSLVVTTTLRNLGLVAAPAFRVAFFMSRNDPTPGAGVPIGFRDVGGLGAGVVSTLVTSVTVPAELETGPYFLSVIVDSRGVVSELDETNNGLTAASAVNVSWFRPDLTVTAFTAPASGQTGRPLSVTATVRNSGPAPAARFRVLYYLSPTGEPISRTLIGFSQLSGLAAGASVNVPASLLVPLHFDAGDYFVVAVADGYDFNELRELDETNNERTADRPVTITLNRPDPAILSLTAPGTGQTGRPLAVKTLVGNLGSMATPASLLLFFMSATDSWPGAGTIVGSRDLPSLAPGANTSFVTSVTIPIGFDAADYFLSAIIVGRNLTSLTELDQVNNMRTAPERVSVALARPDLTIAALTVPPTGQTGKPLAVTARLRNTGPTAALAFRVAFFMSPSDSTPGAGTRVGVRDVGGLAAGANVSISTTVTVPIGFDPGPYFLSAVADAANSVVELDETNNGLTAANQVNIGLLRSDLTILDLRTAATAQTGRALPITATIRNVGSVASPGFRLTFFMSDTDPTPGAGRAVGFRDMPGIAAGSNASVVTTVVVPIDFGSGAFFVSAIADSGQVVTELDETNNGLTAATPVAVTALRSDLAVLEVSAPADGQPGRPLVFTTILRNVGVVAAPAFRLMLFMSDIESPGSGELLGTRLVAGLAPNISTTLKTTVTVPTSLLPGTYFVSAFVQSDVPGSEDDVTNNGLTAREPVNLTPYRPDLYMEVVTEPLPAASIAGRPISVISSVRNVGPAPAGAFRIAFYLSSDAALDEADILLGTRPVAGLGPNGVSLAASSLIVPALTPPADYFLIAVVDPEQNIAELAEINNVSVAPTTVAILPNLVGTFPGEFSVELSECADPALEQSYAGVGTLRIPTQAGAAFSGTSSFASTFSGAPAMTTISLSGSTDPRSDFVGTFTLRTLVGATTVVSSTGSMAGSIFGRTLSGTLIAGTTMVSGGGACRLTASVLAARSLP